MIGKYLTCLPRAPRLRDGCLHAQCPALLSLPFAVLTLEHRSDLSPKNSFLFFERHPHIIAVTSLSSTRGCCALVLPPVSVWKVVVCPSCRPRMDVVLRPSANAVARPTSTISVLICFFHLHFPRWTRNLFCSIHPRAAGDYLELPPLGPFSEMRGGWRQEARGSLVPHGRRALASCLCVL